MTNREKYGEQILEILRETRTIPAIISDKPTGCEPFTNKCAECQLNGDCTGKLAEWLKQEYVPKPDIPLDTPIDTPILVWNNGLAHKMHFAGFKDKKIKAWSEGRTSWTARSGCDFGVWDHAALANKDESIK